MQAEFVNSDQCLHPRIIRLPEVILRVGKGKTSIYQDLKRGLFPPQAKRLNGSRSAGWFEDEIDKYLAARRNGREWAGVETASGESQGSCIPSAALLPVQPDKNRNTKPALQQIPNTIPAYQEGDLMQTGMKLMGGDVYLHHATGRLFLELGRAPGILVAQIGTGPAINRPALSSE